MKRSPDTDKETASAGPEGNKGSIVGDKDPSIAEDNEESPKPPKEHVGQFRGSLKQGQEAHRVRVRIRHQTIPATKDAAATTDEQSESSKSDTTSAADQTSAAATAQKKKLEDGIKKELQKAGLDSQGKMSYQSVLESMVRSSACYNI